MTVVLDMYTWIGIGSFFIFLFLLALLWLCRVLKLLPNDRISLWREVTQVKRFTNHTSIPQSPLQGLSDETVFFHSEDQQKLSSKTVPLNTHYSHYYKYVRNTSSSERKARNSFEKQRSLYDSFPSRSMSRILWQDLTMTTSDNAIIEEEFTTRGRSRDRDSLTKNENVEIRRVCTASRRIFRQAWGENSVKIFLFAKLVAGYYTVDRSGKLCKVNDWRHVSGKDLHYREKAIFELVCLNQLQISHKILENQHQQQLTELRQEFSTAKPDKSLVIGPSHLAI